MLGEECVAAAASDDGDGNGTDTDVGSDECESVGRSEFSIYIEICRGFGNDGEFEFAADCSMYVVVCFGCTIVR